MMVLMGDGDLPADLDGWWRGVFFFTMINCFLVTIYLYKFEHYHIHHIGGA